MRAYQMNKLWWFFGYFGLAFIMMGSLLPSDPGPQLIPNLDKLLHFSGYSIATFYFQQLTRNQKSILIFLLLLSYGGLIEILQGFTATREMSWLDLLANGLGCLFGSFMSLKVFKNLLLKLDSALWDSKSP